MSSGSTQDRRPDDPRDAASAGVSEAQTPPAASADAPIGPETTETAAVTAPSSTAEPAAAIAAQRTAGTSQSAPTVAAPRKGVSPLVAGMIAVLVLLAGGAGLWFGVLKPGQQAAVEAQAAGAIAEMNAALQDLEGRQARMRQQLDTLAPRLDGLERTLGTMRQTVDRLATQDKDAVLDASQLKDIGDRVTFLESQLAVASGLVQQVRTLEASTAVARDTASKLATTVLGVAQLAQAVNEGDPFIRQLAVVRALGGDDPDIAQSAAQLEPYAGAGVPTLAVLRAKFPEMADAVVRAEPVTEGDAWSDRVLERVASLVAIRRVGSSAIAGGGVDGSLAEVEAALGDGNLQAAVTALQKLEGAPAAAADGWLSLAQQRLAAERSLTSLQQRAIARLTAAKG